MRLLILFTIVLFKVSADGPSFLVQLACQRDPSLSFCHSSAVEGVSTSVIRSTNPVLSSNDKLLLEDIASSVTRVGGNPFTSRTVRQPPRKDSDLREKDTDPEGFIAEEGERHVPNTLAHPVESVTSTASPTTTEDTEEVQGFKGEKAEYCDNYEQHFSFYCVGEHEGDQESTGKFCKSYKNACPNKAVTSGSGVTEWPADPFVSKTRVRSREKSVEIIEDAEVTEEELYYNELKKRFPCKPDCDHRLFPHCTAECKCDYIYPAVQRFCNPPPMPLFLNTCRLWYNGCPKYDGYHYASQFVYSKAEKGKVLPGISTNPYGIGRGPLAEGSPTALRPLARGATTHAEEILFIPPPLPPGYKEKIRANRSRMERVELVDVFEAVHKRSKDRRRRRRRLTAKSTPPPPIDQKQLFRTLRALNALTSNPTKLTQDILGQGGQDSVSPRAYSGETAPSRPKAHAPSVFPVIPSDAAIGAGGDPFTRFGGLTDNKGILHRPRSSSPFTKPGLWAANPDDPHNRDHANKYFYAPSSVGVDWLNGQLQWGAHWAVPAAQVGGTNGFSTVHFPTIGNFLNIPDDYD